MAKTDEPQTHRKLFEDIKTLIYEARKTVTRNINTTSQRLTGEFCCGFSFDNLELMRRFYFVYSKSETLSRKSELLLA